MKSTAGEVGRRDLGRRLFRLVARPDSRRAAADDQADARDQYSEEAFAARVASACRFLSRFGSSLHVAGASALDIGCGSGALCVELARRGAERVVGVDIQPLDWAHHNLSTYCPQHADRVHFVATDGSLRELGGERFDLVLSKDSFEHYDDPEAFISVITRHLAPGGRLAIGFGPLWKGPTGGHIDYMTRLPWAHLLFSESTIMRERRRYRPHEAAERFEDIHGGLNKMTLARFERIMREAGLQQRYFATNVSVNPVVRAMKVASLIPALREYFTANAYGIWEARSDGAHGDP